MADKPGLSYRREERASRWPRLVLFIAVLTLPVLIYVLFELQSMPYRPPQDMRTLLSGSEIKRVRRIIGALSIIWVLCVFTLARIYRQRISN